VGPLLFTGVISERVWLFFKTLAPGADLVYNSKKGGIFSTNILFLGGGPVG